MSFRPRAIAIFGASAAGLAAVPVGVALMLARGQLPISLLAAATPALLVLARNRATYLVACSYALFLCGAAYPLFRVDLGPLTLTNSDLALYALLGASLAWSPGTKQRAAPGPAAMYGLLVLVATNGLISIARGLDGGIWADLRPTLGILMFFAIRRGWGARSAQALRSVLLKSARAALVLGVGLMVVSFVASTRLELAVGMVDPASGIVRLAAEPLLLLAAPLLLSRESGVRRSLLAVGFGLLLLASQTLTIVAALLLTWALTQTLYRPPASIRRRRPLWVIISAAVVALVLLGSASSSGSGRPSLGRFDPNRAESTSARYRVDETQAAVRSVATSPLSLLVGRGLGSTITLGGATDEATGYQTITKSDTHNFYINVLVKYGAVGLVALIWWILWTLRRLRLQGKDSWHLGVGLLALSLTSFAAPFLWTLQGWALLGLVSAWATSGPGCSYGARQRHHPGLALTDPRPLP